MTNTVYVNPFKATSTIFSDWDNAVESDEKTSEEPKGTPYDTLAAVVELSKTMYGTEIHTNILQENYPNNFEISSESYERADQVRKHFKNNFLLRRLKNQHISEWMNTVDQALDSPRKIKKEWLAPLITLPMFYGESVATAEIFKNVQSLDPHGIPIHFSGEIEFVGKVHRIAKRENLWRYYFKDRHNHLMVLNLESHSPAIPVWNYIIKSSNSIEIKASVAHHKHPAFDTLHYRLTSDYEIVKVNS
jgi:hypothetical protein